MKLGSQQINCLLLAYGRATKRIVAASPETRRTCASLVKHGLFVQDGDGSYVYNLTDAGAAHAKQISDA